MALSRSTILLGAAAENVYLIDLNNGGQVMTATEMDAMMHQEYTEAWALEGSVYPTGEPLSSESRAQGNQLL
jgi:hypothetical protein